MNKNIMKNLRRVNKISASDLPEVVCLQPVFSPRVT